MILMKNSIAILSVMLCVFSTQAQINEVVSGSKKYQDLKVSGILPDLINSGEVTIRHSSVKPSLPKKGGTTPNDKTPATCFAYTDPVLGAIQTGINVDDAPSTGPITIPFNFCLYGTNYTSFFINTNGNVTFGAAFSTFTATPFPSATIPAMLAPFWGDVDTQMGNGIIHYEILPDAVIINWVGVGYFNDHGDKLNTFQLIFTDGTSPLVQVGANVGFFYEDMAWTTGDASGGANGFGGTPATVGVNEGNGTDFIQIGLFDGPGLTYDGPTLTNDSVDWLDNKAFMFDVCGSGGTGGSSNIPPIISGIDACDTIKICLGDTLNINAFFIDPDVGQIASVDVDTTLANGFQISNIISGTGSTASVNATFIGNTLGVDIIHFTVYDNAVPPDTIEFDYIIKVESISISPVITGDNAYCPGDNVTLSGNNGFDSYLWSNTASTQVTTVSQGNYTFTGTLGGCSVTSLPFIVLEYPLPIVQITGAAFVCQGESTLLSATPGYENYLWNTSPNDTLDTLLVPFGSYSVTITDINTCTNTSNTLVVSESVVNASITGVTATLCPGETILITAEPPFNSYLWSSGESTLSISAGLGTHSVTVTNAFQCSDTETITIISKPVPQVNFTISPEESGHPNIPVIFTDASTISSGNIIAWDWNFDVANLNGATPIGAATQGSHNVTYTEQGPLTVTLSVTSDSTCTGTYSRDYLIISDIIIPNVLTPNGDGSNDFLIFTNLQFHEENKLVILNRWGGKVFEKENYNNDWDGGGQPEGTYFYVLTVNDIDDPIKGTMTLFK